MLYIYYFTYLLFMSYDILILKLETNAKLNLSCISLTIIFSYTYLIGFILCHVNFDIPIIII